MTMPRIVLVLACLASVSHGRRLAPDSDDSGVIEADHHISAFNPSVVAGRPSVSHTASVSKRSPAVAQGLAVFDSVPHHSSIEQRASVPVMHDKELVLESSTHSAEEAPQASSAPVQSSASKAQGNTWWWSKVLATRWAVMASITAFFCKFGPLQGTRSGQVVANAGARDPTLIDPKDFTQDERNFFLSREQRESKREMFLQKGYGSALLIGGTILSLWLANSPLAGGYIGFWDKVVGVGAPEQHLKMTIRTWVNEAMMAFFFFGVGLEIKNEVLFGSLKSLKQAALPCMGALGGMLVPAFLYITVQAMGGFSFAGWAVPMATDIAFAMGIYNLFRNRMPAGAAAFLLTLATVDDLGAIAVIAVAFSSHINWFFLSLAAAACGLFEIMRRNRVRNSKAWISTGVALWYFLLRGGVNADIAGVLAAFFVPTVCAPFWTKAPGALPNLIDHFIHYWVGWSNFLIMPLFAIANTAVAISGGPAATLASPVAQGILLGLLVGKPLGIAGLSWLSLKAGLCKLPTGMSLIHLIICGLLGGIAFTMSLFLIEQSLFGASVMYAKLAVIGGSTIAAIAGMVLMYMRKPVEEDPY